MSQIAKGLASTPLSILDLVNYSDNQSIADAFETTRRLSKSAEKWGYHRYWLAEHHGLEGTASSATAILIGFVAQNTTSIRVGSGGIMLANHSPLMVAEQFGTLATLYPNRIDLGVGRAPGSDRDTMMALRRGLQSQGEDFPELLEELFFFFGPNKSEKRIKAIPGGGIDIPIWILGSSIHSAHFSARMGLPYAFASHFAPQELFEAISIYKNEFRPSEYLKKPYIMIGVPIVAAESDEQAAYLATTLYQRFIGLVRRKIMPARPPVRSLDGLWNEEEQAYVNSMLKIAIIGGPLTVKQKLEDLISQTGADELIITSDNYRPKDKLNSFKIIADLKKTI